MDSSLINTQDIKKNDLFQLFEKSYSFSQNQPSKSLNNKVVGLFFFEPSTRTKLSFELAAKKLGAHVLNFQSEGSSLSKGETILDTVKTLEAMGTDIAVIRHKDENLIHDIGLHTSLKIINAGSGTREHPTQCLLDLFTLHQHFGTLDITLAMVGDIAHSRVANSHLRMAQELGLKILLAGPDCFLPKTQDLPQNVEIVSIEEAMTRSQAMMMLRYQNERHQQVSDLSPQQLHQNFGLTLERYNKLPKETVILHPAPVNHNIELAYELMEKPNVLIYKQVQNGIYMRMAILETLAQT